MIKTEFTLSLVLSSTLIPLAGTGGHKQARPLQYATIHMFYIKSFTYIIRASLEQVKEKDLRDI